VVACLYEIPCHQTERPSRYAISACSHILSHPPQAVVHEDPANRNSVAFSWV